METESYNRQLLDKLVASTISKEEYRILELEALDDPFLFDALEGYTLNKNIEFSKNLNKVQHQIDQYLPKNKKRTRLLYFIAASITGIAVIGLIVLNIYRNEATALSNSQNPIAVQKKDMSSQMNNKSEEISMSKRTETDESRENKTTYLSQTKDEKNTTSNYRSNVNLIQNKISEPTTNIGEIASNYEMQVGILQDSSNDISDINTIHKQQKTSLPSLNADKPKMINIDENFYAGVSSKTKRLTGTVYDALGNPIIGASVVAGANGTITDIDGKYDLIINDRDEIIKVNFEGFESKDIEISQNIKEYDIILNDNTTLDEIVVVGYKRPVAERNMSHSTTTISSKKDNKTKDKEEDWKSFDQKVNSAIKKELQKLKYQDEYIAKFDFLINEKNKVTDIKIDSTSDHNIDQDILKTLNKTKNKIPPTNRTNYILEVRINE